MQLGHRGIGGIAAGATAVVVLLSALYPTHVDGRVDEPDQPAPAGAAEERPGAEPLSATETFYPVVRDGWRDKARFAWRVDGFYREWAAVVRVTDEQGLVVERRRLRDNPVEFTWDGRAGGEPVAAGEYAVDVGLRLETPDPLTRRQVRQVLTFPVRAATKSVERTETTVIRPARHPGVAVSVRGNCFSRPELTGSLLLNCHPVGQMRAVITIPVPDGATVASYSHKGQILCCAPGNVQEVWSQPDPDTLTLAIRVTGDRRYRLWSVLVTYSFRDEA